MAWVRSEQMQVATVPVLWLEVVQTVAESLVELALCQAAEKTEGQNSLESIHQPVELHIEGKATVPNSVENPGSSTCAQVQL